MQQNVALTLGEERLNYVRAIPPMLDIDVMAYSGVR